MNLIHLSLLVIALAAGFVAAKTSYEGYRLLHVFPVTQEQIDLIIQLEEKQDFDIWNNGRALKAQVDVALSPLAYLKYKQLFELYNIKYEVVSQNIQAMIDEQDMSEQVIRMARGNNLKANIVGVFPTVQEIYDWLDELERNFSSEIKVEKIGKSHQNRDLTIIRINANKDSQRKVWIDCGIHAREWISPATCIYFIDYLVKQMKSANPDPTTKALLDHYEWIIMPTLNPDGYQYSKTTTRLWRKNRRINSGTTCIGVDLNRNWGYKWLTGGSSPNPCDDTYAGPLADSEPETQAVQDFITKKTKGSDYDAYLTIHTYGLWWFTPWGYTKTLPTDYNDIMVPIGKGKDAIKASLNNKGSNFVTGSSAVILYIASGGSEDWAKGVAGIKHSTCLELRPGQSGTDANYGFTLPADRIPDVGTEMTNGLIAYMNHIRVNGV